MSDEMGPAVVGCLVVRGAVRLVVRWCVRDCEHNELHQMPRNELQKMWRTQHRTKQRT